MAKRPTVSLLPVRTLDREGFKTFLDKPAYTLASDGSIGWKTKQELEASAFFITTLCDQGLSRTAIVAKLRTGHRAPPCYVIEDIIKRYRSVQHMPSASTVMELRLAGWPVTRIAKERGCTVDDVRAMLEHELRHLEGPVEQYALEVARTDQFFAALQPQIAAGNLAAIQVAVRISEHKLAVIQTQMEAAKAIRSGSQTLTQLLGELDAEGLSDERPNEIQDVGPQSQGDDGSSIASSITDP